MGLFSLGAGNLYWGEEFHTYTMFTIRIWLFYNITFIRETSSLALMDQWIANRWWLFHFPATYYTVKCRTAIFHDRTCKRKHVKTIANTLRTSTLRYLICFNPILLQKLVCPMKFSFSTTHNIITKLVGSQWLQSMHYFSGTFPYTALKNSQYQFM